MKEILEKIGLSPIMILIVIVLIFLLKEIWSMIRTTRSKFQQDIIMQIIRQIDNQLEEFYLPLASRFKVSKNINITIQNLREKERLENEKLNIKSSNKRALRDIVVRKIFLPLNNEMERIILEKSYLSLTDDRTDYSKILTHFMLWKSLEQSIIEGDIEKYSADELLTFPSHEVETFLHIVEELIKRRNELRLKLLNYQNSIPFVKKFLKS